MVTAVRLDYLVLCCVVCVCVCVLLLFVFFQAEDGIRDLVRSRGLGDVYKRQVLAGRVHNAGAMIGILAAWGSRALAWETLRPADAPSVSYTHLTLPTSDLV